jgi:hypothetical protein
MMMIALMLAALQGAEAPNLQIREAHERRGAILLHLDGLAAESAPACAAACALNAECRAWTWREGDPFRAARCDLQAHVTTPTPQPGAITGLSPAFVAEINAAMDRPLSARERAAARATADAPPQAPADIPNEEDESELAGG